MTPVDSRKNEENTRRDIECMFNEKLEWQYEMVANAMQTARRKKRTNAPVTPNKENRKK